MPTRSKSQPAYYDDEPEPAMLRQAREAEAKFRHGSIEEGDDEGPPLAPWRQPEDLVALCQTAAAELPSLFAAGRGGGRWSDHMALADLLLSDDAVAIVAALKAAIRAGAAPTDLGRSLAYAAALRVARFGSANEHSDWETAHHVFTYANAVHQMLKRIETANQDGHFEAVRGILHGAMALYLARYLTCRRPASLATAATG